MRLLRGQPTQLKSGVDAATGARYVEALERIGGAVRLEPETLDVDADLSEPTAIIKQDQPRDASSIVGARVGERFQAERKFRSDEQQRHAMGGRPASASGKAGSEPDGAALAWPRLWARQIDFALCVAIALGLAFLVGATHLLATANIFVQLGIETLLGTLLIFLVLIGYETLFLTTFGTTLGKAVLGLRVEPQSGTKIEFQRALRRSLGVLWLGCWAYVGFPVVTFIAWNWSRRCLRKTGSTPWDDSCNTRIAGGPVPLWRATLAGVIAIIAFTSVFVYNAMEWQEMKREAHDSIARSYGIAPTPAATAGPSDQLAALDFVDPWAMGYKSGPIDPDYVDAGDPSTLLNIGVRYAYGLSGTPQDYVEAAKWLNLAASRFPASQAVERNHAIRVLDDVQSRMTPAQIAEAERRARECGQEDQRALKKTCLASSASPPPAATAAPSNPYADPDFGKTPEPRGANQATTDHDPGPHADTQEQLAWAMRHYPYLRDENAPPMQAIIAWQRAYMQHSEKPNIALHNGISLVTRGIERGDGTCWPKELTAEQLASVPAEKRDDPRYIFLAKHCEGTQSSVHIPAQQVLRDTPSFAGGP